jgi:peptide-methionine (R)-S-oxide reductase
MHKSSFFILDLSRQLSTTSVNFRQLPSTFDNFRQFPLVYHQRLIHMTIFRLLTYYCLIFGITAITFSSCAYAQDQRSKEVKADAQQKQNPYYSRTDTTKLNVPDAEWKKILSPNVYYIAREKGTERAFTGHYWDFEGLGTYYCAVCGNKLFVSEGKFASECGWPSFFETVRPAAVTYQDDFSHNMERIEVNCGRCGSHLGHLFDDGPPPTYKRYCMNSAVLEFEWL